MTARLGRMALVLGAMTAWSGDTVIAAQKRSAATRAPATVPLLNFRVGGFLVGLRTDTQTLARLSPSGEPAFSFTPFSHEAARSGDGHNHLGDLHLRVRAPGATWRDLDSSRERRPVVALPAGGAVLARADMTASMGASSPVAVERRWERSRDQLVLRFRLTNRTSRPLELGIVGMPMVFDNILTGRSLDDAHRHGSFVDPYIGRDAGYLQVTRLNGRGPALLVLPEGRTPLEAFAPLLGPDERPAAPFVERARRDVSFEGFHDWTVHSGGYVGREWPSAAAQWNTPTTGRLAAGEAVEYAVRFAASPDIRSLERTLAGEGRPVAVGIPGYVLPADQQGSLFLKAPAAVTSVASEPAGALRLTSRRAEGGWHRYVVEGAGWGPVRLTVTYADGRRQTISYFLTKPLAQLSSDLGRFATTRQWFDDPHDPFHRAPAIIGFDREVNDIVRSDHRMWIPGMGDEAGSGSWLAATVKQLDNPDPAEIAKIERFVDETLVGKLQIAAGEHIGGVRKSLVWYDPVRFPDQYRGPKDPDWWRYSWDRKEADRLDRTYNYPHVAVVHWVLYRLARNHPGFVARHDWHWYLQHAYLTSMAMMRDASLYAEFGLMEGNVFVDILEALKQEKMTGEATQMEAAMRVRAEHWRGLRYPFGSEMPWDSTGQPEVYAWMRYFGFTPQAEQTREVILGYDPAIPSWGYNGNARRYWDFGTAGKYERVERMIHHYGSGLNALPLLDAFRRNPTDIHLLRVGYGGIMGAVTGVDREGFASTGFHSWPDMMSWDPYSGDFGIGFFGHAYATGTYVVHDPTFGWLGFGGAVETEADGTVAIVPQDGARSRLFVAPAGQWITLEAGKIARAVWDPGRRDILLTLDPADRFTPAARIMIEAPAPGGTAMRPIGGTFERGAYTVTLGAAPAGVRLVMPK